MLEDFATSLFFFPFVASQVPAILSSRSRFLFSLSLSLSLYLSIYLSIFIYIYIYIYIPFSLSFSLSLSLTHTIYIYIYIYIYICIYISSRPSTHKHPQAHAHTYDLKNLKIAVFSFDRTLLHCLEESIEMDSIHTHTQTKTNIHTNIILHICTPSLLFSVGQLALQARFVDIVGDPFVYESDGFHKLNDTLLDKGEVSSLLALLVQKYKY
jgi:hypothetical protein